MKLNKTILIAFIVIFFASCAPTQHHLSNCLEGDTYGFWGGLWHGIIAPISFVIGLFNDNVSVWAANNNGGWYTFGFILGIGGLTKSGSDAASK